MSIIVQPEDFVGFYAIPQSKNSDLQDWLDQFERELIDELLGCELATLFFADLDGNGVPQSPRFTDIYSKFCIEINEISTISQGIPDMLKGLIYMLYLRDQQVTSDLNGTKRDLGENTQEDGNAATTKFQQRYNRGVASYHAIQIFIDDDPDTYPEFEGIIKETIFL